MNFVSKKFIVLLNALIFTFAFNTPLLLQRYMNYKAAGDSAIYALLGEFLFAVAFVYPFIFSLSINRFIFKFLLVFSYVFSGLCAYFVYKFNINITSEIVAAFFESSKEEVHSFINLEILLCLVSSAFLAWICVFTVRKSKLDADQNKKITFITAIFTIGCLVGDGDWVNNILPYNILKQSGTYALEKTSIVKKRFDISKEYNYELDENSTKDLNVILIIGESARGDRFSLSGYKKETNPLLAKEDNNLAYYKNVTACYPLTRVAVPCMITRATRADRSASKLETSFISVFRKMGFYTAWFGMQGTYTAIDAPYFDLAKESDKALLLGTDVDIFKSNDSSLFPLVDEFVQSHKDGRNLLVLHTYGSHFHYEERYTDEFRKFMPVCKKKKFITDMSHCSIEEITNSYDNSILFTDYFIKSIIDKFRDRKTLVIYTSDHGESLGEGGRFLHGTYNAGEQIDVSMVFWASDKYIKAFPENVKNLRKFQDKSILHDHLFHSILGCSGLKSSIIENKLNLCAK
jgi:glucan phosphoethanolaminetransferase (alkaline phosphatase superfamily)